MNMLMRIPRIARLLYKDAIWDFPKKKGKIFLTFDDGPSSATPQLLEVLERRQAKATFFCCGRQAEKFPDAMRQIIEQGHCIGHHGYNHLNGWKTRLDDYLIDVEKAANIIDSNLFRPPYGKISFQQFNALKKKYNIFFWDLLTYDFHPKFQTRRCVDAIEREINKSPVVVFHDSPDCFYRSYDTLRYLIDAYGGATFETLQ